MERAVATIDRAALVHNLARVRDLAPAGEIFAAVKADGYGHGVGVVASTLAEAGCDGFAVSSLEEALQLRWSGITQPIMTLSQPLSADVLEAMGEHAITPVIFERAHLAALHELTAPACARQQLVRALAVVARLGEGTAEVGTDDGEQPTLCWHAARRLDRGDAGGRV